MLKITEYADRLIDDLDLLDWPEKVKLMQRHWIGRSRGAQVCFPIVGSPEHIEVFTTRPDTLFGATFMVVAPEHPILASLVPDGDWPDGTPPEWTGGAATPGAAVAERRHSGRLPRSRRECVGPVDRPGPKQVEVDARQVGHCVFTI